MKYPLLGKNYFEYLMSQGPNETFQS